MRRMIIICIVFILLLSYLSIAFAEDRIYAVDDLSMHMTIPSEFVVFTRVIDEGDPNLSVIDIDKESLLASFSESHIYLKAWHDELPVQVTVTMIENDDMLRIFDFNTYSQSMLDTFAQDTPASVSREKEGDNIQDIMYNQYFIYSHTQAVFIAYDTILENNDTENYFRQYITIINGQGINITMRSTDAEITSESIQALERMIDSIIFEKVQIKPTMETTTATPGAVVTNVPAEDIVQIQDEEPPLASEKAPLSQNKIIALILLSTMTMMLLFLIIILVKRGQPKKRHVTGHGHRDTRRRY
ncbi:MAG: hypothetical protein KAQ68_08440 [Clostridiales bacterium]|nr:hypothetical protein [Clostridiales bacterium]